jgi:hypothetical protein
MARYRLLASQFLPGIIPQTRPTPNRLPSFPPESMSDKDLPVGLNRFRAVGDYA